MLIAEKLVTDYNNHPQDCDSYIEKMEKKAVRSYHIETVDVTVFVYSDGSMVFLPEADRAMAIHPLHEEVLVS